MEETKVSKAIELCDKVLRPTFTEERMSLQNIKVILDEAQKLARMLKLAIEQRNNVIKNWGWPQVNGGIISEQQDAKLDHIAEEK
jgi:hypothetical protein